MSRILVITVLILLGPPATRWLARADDQAIIGRIEEFFRSDDPEKLTQITNLIADDPSFDRVLLSDWLHRARLYQLVEPGTTTIEVPQTEGRARRLTVRVPPAYDPRRPYPVVYTLPNSGQSSIDAILAAEKSLGGIAGAFLIAAPDDSQPKSLAEDWPPSADLPACLTELRRRYHVQSDRVYLLAVGSSGGDAGDLGWTSAALYADQLAGAILAGGALRLPGNDALYGRFAPNLARLPILIAAPSGESATSQPIDAPALHARLAATANRAGIKMPWTTLGPDAAARALAEQRWPADQLQNQLAAAREHAPRKLRHCFRHAAEAHAYWLEGRDWLGAQWDDKPLRPARSSTTAPADDDAAIARAIGDRLGELSGEIRDQEIIVNRKGVAELTVWVIDDMIQWSRAVRVQCQGDTVFHGQLKPDLLLCLTLAEQTRDFDFLRWSAIRWKAGQKGRILKTSDLP